MIKVPDIVSIKSQINLSGKIHSGILLAEEYNNGKVIVLERIYNNLTGIEIDIAVAHGKEQYLDIIKDWGELYEISNQDIEEEE